jgi:GH24 family phage-related lysozyme (muramidase)
MNLENVKAGDLLAVRNLGVYGRELKKLVVERTTKTRVVCFGHTFTRRGNLVGGSAFNSAWAETWEPEKHEQELKETRAEARLKHSRRLLAETNWRTATQEQADAIVDAMLKCGMKS